MNIIMCPRGHSYDSDVYMECPYCTNPEYMGNYGGGPMDDYQTIVGSENDYRTIVEPAPSAGSTDGLTSLFNDEAPTGILIDPYYEGQGGNPMYNGPVNQNPMYNGPVNSMQPGGMRPGMGPMQQDPMNRRQNMGPMQQDPMWQVEPMDPMDPMWQQTPGGRQPGRQPEPAQSPETSPNLPVLYQPPVPKRPPVQPPVRNTARPPQGGGGGKGKGPEKSKSSGKAPKKGLGKEGAAIIIALSVIIAAGIILIAVLIGKKDKDGGGTESTSTGNPFTATSEQGGSDTSTSTAATVSAFKVEVKLAKMDDGKEPKYDMEEGSTLEMRTSGTATASVIPISGEASVSSVKWAADNEFLTIDQNGNFVLGKKNEKDDGSVSWDEGDSGITATIQASDGQTYTIHFTVKYLHLGWAKEGKNWVVYKNNGSKVTGLKMLHKQWFYFDKNGIMKEGFQKIEEKYYLFKAPKEGEQAPMATGFVQHGGKWYYFETKDDGMAPMLASTWLELTKDENTKKAGWYYFDENGEMVTGTREIDGKKYEFDSNGRYIE